MAWIETPSVDQVLIDQVLIDQVLLDGLGAVGAAGGVVHDGVVLIRAVAVIARPADCIGDCGELEGVVLVLVVDGGLGAAGNGERIAGLVSGGGEGGVEKLSAFGRGRAGFGISAEQR